MNEIFDITKFDSYKEDKRREVKKTKDGLSRDMWETYSAFANTNGGVIILGAKELEDKNWETTGLKAEDKEKLLDDLWNLLHNRQKVNVNLLREENVEEYEVSGDLIIVIYVPRAKREQKPVYINDDLFGGTFQRDDSGVRGVVIKKERDKLIFENPGYIRTGKEQMIHGGLSDPGNKILLKMFNMVDVGERAGSGVPNIFNTWEDEGWVEPVIEEQFNPDRTILTLEFKKKQVKKATEKSDRKKRQKKATEKK